MIAAGLCQEHTARSSFGGFVVLRSPGTASHDFAARRQAAPQAGVATAMNG